VRYSCGSYTRYGKGVCSAHSVSFGDLERSILDDIGEIISSLDDLPSLIDSIPAAQTHGSDDENERARLETELAELASHKLSLYEDYRDGLISRQEYLLLRERYADRESLLNKKAAALDRADPDGGSASDTPWIRHLLEHRGIQSIDREILAELIDSIYVYEDRRIRIVYNFCREDGTTKSPNFP